jgi:hypothetical protein
MLIHKELGERILAPALRLIADRPQLAVHHNWSPAGGWRQRKKCFGQLSCLNEETW